MAFNQHKVIEPETPHTAHRRTLCVSGHDVFPHNNPLVWNAERKPSTGVQKHGDLSLSVRRPALSTARSPAAWHHEVASATPVRLLLLQPRPCQSQVLSCSWPLSRPACAAPEAPDAAAGFTREADAPNCLRVISQARPPNRAAAPSPAPVCRRSWGRGGWPASRSIKMLSGPLSALSKLTVKSMMESYLLLPAAVCPSSCPLGELIKA